jgi:hypothetical protein
MPAGGSPAARRSRHAPWSVLAPIAVWVVDISVQKTVFEVLQPRGVLFARRLTMPPLAAALAVVPALAALVERLIVLVRRNHTAPADMLFGGTPST